VLLKHYFTYSCVVGRLVGLLEKWGSEK